jgi:hypothetical protein
MFNMKKSAKPFSATAVLRQVSPRQTLYANRFACLSNSRDPSPSPSVGSESEFRQRAQSTKRKHDENSTPSYATVTGSFDSVSGTGVSSSAPVQAPALSEAEVEKVTIDITKVKSICSKVSEDLTKVEIPPEIACIFNHLCEAVGLVSNVQETLLKVAVKPQVTQQATSGNSEWVTLGAVSKKLRPGNVQKLLPQGVNNSQTWQPAKPAIQVTEAQEQVDPVVKKFNPLTVGSLENS